MRVIKSKKVRFWYWF